ncbi:MAG TPA: MBL fold metallo-hydrolase [Thermoanaerobaculia bacterium]|nr:MBL fold metallo-hydrolase [Thermoanaerobaculia bacterium]
MLVPGRWLIAMLLALTGCGSVVSNRHLDAGSSDFDFRHPGCPQMPAAVDAAEVRYLGSGGAAVTWRGDTILLGPYFSRPGGVLQAQFGSLQFDLARIEAGMSLVDAAKVRAILVGHSHFDHFGDVPILLDRYVPQARVFTNIDGAYMLAAYPEHQSSIQVIDKIEGEWVGVGAAMRIKPVRWDHAPQVCRWRDGWPCTYAKCRVGEEWTQKWDTRKLKHLCGGSTYAYLIDLLEPGGGIALRLFYNDAAAGGHHAKHVGENIDHGRPVDVAIVSVPSYHLVTGYPEELLRAVAPRHVVLTHYEDFFVRSRDRWRFVPLLTNSRADHFIRTVVQETGSLDNVPLRPVAETCGPSTARWSIPAPGWPLYFRP